MANTIDPRIKQGEFCRVTINNGDEEYGFDLDYLLAFGIFAEGKIGGHPNVDGTDKYLAIGIQSSKAKAQTRESMNSLQLRMLDVLAQTYASWGLSYQEMTQQIQNDWLFVMARHLKQARNLASYEEASNELAKEMGWPKREK